MRFCLFRTCTVFSGSIWFLLQWIGFRFSWFPGFGFCLLMSLEGGVCSWNILANWVKSLLGNLLGVEGLVSTIGFFGVTGLVSRRFVSIFGLFFLVVMAKPWCLMSCNLVSIFTNCFWLQCGCGFGFSGLVLGFGTGFGFFWFSMDNLGNLGVSAWFFLGLLFLLGVE